MKRIRAACVAIGAVAALSACAAGDEKEAPGRSEASLADSEPIASVSLPREIMAAAADATRRGPAKRDVAHVPIRGTPIHEPGSDAIAFWEVDLEPGWAVIRAGEHPRVVELNTSGEGPVARLVKTAPSATRAVRLDTAIYVLTDASGHAVAQSTPFVARIDRSGATARLVPVTPEQAIAELPAARAELQEVLARSIEDDGPAPRQSCAVPGDIPNYTQIPPGEAPNDTRCASGCGPTGWAMIFGWASKRAAQNRADAAYAGLFRSGDDALGSIVVAPDFMDATVRELTWTLREQLSTFCLTDQGATTPWSMDNAADFVSARAPGVRVEVDYSTFMTMSSRLRGQAVDAICDGRPAIIGIGSLFAANMHYPVAKAYDDGMFELEMGWGGSGDGWYDTSSWFVGTIRR
jgi:hypothetical protein